MLTWLDWRRADDLENVKFTPSSERGFLVLLLSGNNDKGNIAKTAQQSREIQYALLRSIGSRQGPMGRHKKDFRPIARNV